jgi:glutathione peroxidase
MKTGCLIALNFFCLFAHAQDAAVKNIYDVKMQAYKGGTIDFSQFKGKKIMIVNTPSIADNNPRYLEMEAMYQKYKDKVVVVGVLDEDFGTPPGSKKNAPDNRPKNYPVTFPLAVKSLVRTKNMAPVYKWLTEKKYNHLRDSEVKWDFQKYLVDEHGNLVAVFDPNVKAESPQVVAAISK